MRRRLSAQREAGILLGGWAATTGAGVCFGYKPLTGAALTPSTADGRPTCWLESLRYGALLIAVALPTNAAGHPRSAELPELLSPSKRRANLPDWSRSILALGKNVDGVGEISNSRPSMRNAIR